MPLPAIIWGIIVVGGRVAAPHVIRAGGRQLARQGARQGARQTGRRGAKPRNNRRNCKTCCKVGKFSSLKCDPGYQRHHIVPEYALKNPVSKTRIKGMPSRGQGAAICLKGNATVPGTEHNRAQTATRALLAAAANEHGRASLSAAKNSGVAGLAAAGKDPACLAKAKLQVERSFLGIDGSRKVTADY